MNASQGVAIYPEVVYGNPLQAQHVVRWILYFPGVNGGLPASYHQPSDLVACYGMQYCKGFDPARFYLLDVQTVDNYWDFYLQLPAVETRQGTVVFKGKAKWRNYTRASGVPPLPDTITNVVDMDHTVLKRERLELFARAEMFVSYDLATYRNVEAALTGAISVVMPMEGVSREQWRAESLPEFRYGVAYGFDDVPYALETVHLLKPHLVALEVQHDAGVRHFAQVVGQRFVAGRVLGNP